MMKGNILLFVKVCIDGRAAKKSAPSLYRNQQNLLWRPCI